MPAKNYQLPGGGFDGSGLVSDWLNGAARQVAPSLKDSALRLQRNPLQALIPVGLLQRSLGLPPRQPAASRYAKAREENLRRIASDPRFRDPRSAPLASVAPGMQTEVIALNPDQTRRSQLNAMSQQAGGPNISQRLVPTEAEAEAINSAQQQAQQSVLDYRRAMQDDPVASLPELIDQRSQAYGQRADIQAWIEANKNAPKGADGKNIVKRFLDRQRTPLAEQPITVDTKTAFDPAVDLRPQGMTQASPMSIELAAQDPKRVSQQTAAVRELAYRDDIDLRPGQGDPSNWKTASRSFPVEPAQTFGPELELSVQGTAQDSNLNFNSPLPLANQAQAENTEKTNALLRKFSVQARSLNMPTYGGQ